MYPCIESIFRNLETKKTILFQQQVSEISPVTEAPAESDKYEKGVIFYMKGKKVAGVVCWNVFNKMGIARKVGCCKEHA